MSYLQQKILVLLAFLQLGSVAWLDAASGYEINLAGFYFIPIAFAAWYLARAWSFLLAVLSALTMTWSEVASGRQFSHRWIEWEHVFMQALVFGVMVLSFNRFRSARRRERAQFYQLQGLILNQCSQCSRIKDPDDNWVDFQTLLQNSNIPIQPKLCPTCARAVYAHLA